MKCDKCQSKEAYIHLENVGDFCLDCHNDYMADVLGVKKMNDFFKIFSVDDTDGIKHRFEISNMIMPGFSVWKAEETDGGYLFEVFVKPEENQTVAIDRLHRKILMGIGFKTLSPMMAEHYIDNAINIGQAQYGLNSVGTCRIQQTDEENTVCLVIDGREIPLDGFGRALTAFGDFNMDFQIRDLSEDVLGEKMILRQVSIDPNVIMEHFELTLGWFLERDFLSYKRASNCVEALFERIDELELLYKYGSRDEAAAVGDKMKKRLISIDHDTDNFPEYLLELIDQAIGITE